LKLNNSDIKATQEEKYLTFLQLAEGPLSEAELANWTQANVEFGLRNAE